MIEIKFIGESRKQDVKLPNEPFPLSGKLLPSYRDGRWEYEFADYPEEKTSEMRFPDEDYDYDAMISENSVFLGAYDGESCCGLAILQPGLFK